MAVVIVFGIVGAVVVTSFLFLICFLDVTIGQALKAADQADVSQRRQPSRLFCRLSDIVPPHSHLLVDVLLLITVTMAISQ